MFRYPARAAAPSNRRLATAARVETGPPAGPAVAGRGLRVMKVATGLKAHSGWASLVIVGGERGERPRVLDRRRIELVEEAWAKAPYHAAETMAPEKARSLVRRGTDAAFRIAVSQMQWLVETEKNRGHEIAAVGVLTADPLPDWSADEILAVHFRMHRAEGFLFRNALARAVTECGLRLEAIVEKQLPERAAEILGCSRLSLDARIAALGRGIGPPWAKDQRDAALAALVALATSASRSR